MTSNPMNNMLYLLAVIRLSDKTICASRSTGEVDKEGVRELVASNANIQAEKKYSSNGPSYSIHYTLDRGGRVYAAVTNNNYSPRIAFVLLDEFKLNFDRKLGLSVPKVKEEGLSKQFKTGFNELFEK